MTTQKHTSAGTSINSSKLPAIYSRVKLSGRVLDYGCGRFTDHLKAAAAAAGAAWAGYDKFNQPASVNAAALAAGHYDMVLCSNVLNVIDNLETMRGIVADLASLADLAAVTIYDGDRSGTGRETQNGESWQRNEKLSVYVDRIREWLPERTVYTKNNVLYIA